MSSFESRNVRYFNDVVRENSSPFHWDMNNIRFKKIDPEKMEALYKRVMMFVIYALAIILFFPLVVLRSATKTNHRHRRRR